MMTTNFEQERQVPDKFYLNELKREMTYIAGSDRNDLLQPLDEPSNQGFVYELHHAVDRFQNGDISSLDAVKNLSPGTQDTLWSLINDGYKGTMDRRQLDPLDPRSSVVSLASALTRVAIFVDHIKKEAVGSESSTVFTNRLIATYTNQAVMSFMRHHHTKIRESDLDFMVRASNIAFERVSLEKEASSWQWAKAANVTETMRGAVSGYLMLKELPELDKATIETLRQHSDELASASLPLRTYTTKPAFGSLIAAEYDALFIDPEISTHLVSGNQTHMQLIQIHPSGSLLSSNTELARKRGRDGGVVTRLKVEDMDISQQKSCDVVLLKEGKLTFLGVYLSSFAEQLELAPQAEILRAEILGKSFDLTVPSYIVDLANGESQSTQASTLTDPVADKLRRLLLARTRVLTTLGDDIAEEMQQDLEESNETYRNIERHGVVGHLRKIPDGYAPSESAKALCLKELGIEIPAGRTYVKRHERGNVAVHTKGHTIISRNQSLGAIGIGSNR